jgi:hypothetical protein
MDYAKLAIFNSNGELVYNTINDHSRITLPGNGIYLAVFYLKNKKIITERIIIY